MRLTTKLLEYLLIVLLVLVTGRDFGVCLAEISPEFRLQNIDYSDPLSQVVNQYLWSIRLSAPSNFRVSDSLKFKISPLAQGDLSNKSDREKFFWDIPEGYLEFKKGNYSLQLGENVFSWSGTDGFNPVDVVNARRYFDPIHAEKLGSLSASVRGGWEVFDWQLIYIPRQTKSQLPGENSRWLPRDIYVQTNSSTQIILPSEVNYSYFSDVELDDALKNNYGLRLQWHFRGIDLSLVDFEGTALTPAAVPSVTAQIIQVGSTIIFNAGPNISLQPYYYKHRMTGTTVTFPIGETVFRMAGAYDQPLSSGLDIPNWTYNVVLGLEHSFSLGKGNLTFLPQYSFAQHGDTAGNEVASVTRIFDRAIMGGIRYSPNETWTFLGSYLLDSITSNQFVNLDMAYLISDHLKTDLSGEYFVGTPGTVLGTYRRNNRALVNLSWQL